MFELPIDIIAHSWDRLLLPALLGATLVLARRAAARQAGGMDQLAGLATGLLVCLGVWWVWLGMTAFIGIPRSQWLGPFDRLLQTTSLATVGWLALGRAGGPEGGRRWRLGMVLAFAVVLPVYLGWAPEWARAMQARPAATPPMAAARAWDAWQSLLALGLAWGMVARRPASVWSFGIVGGLLVASVLDVLYPMDAAGVDFAPVWGRMGLLTIGIGMAAHALQRNWELGLLPGLPAVFGGLRAPSDPAVRAPAPAIPALPEAAEPALTRTMAEQAAQIGRLADAVATVSTRLDRLEQPARPAVGPSDQDLLARVHGYEEALRRVPVGLLLTDDRGLLSYANPTATVLLGRAPRPGESLVESLGTSEAFNAALRRLLAGGESPARTDGIPFGSGQLRSELHALRGAEGGIAGILAVLGTDPSSLDATSLGMVPELIQAMTPPITSLLGYSDLIQQGKGAFQGEGQLERYLERIDANLSRLKVMLANLAMVLVVDDAPDDTQPVAPVDLDEQLAQAMERARHQLREKGLRAERSDAALPMLQVDGEAVGLLLDNLLVHAIQRSPIGGDLQLSACGEDGQLVLAVMDRGRMPDGMLPMAETAVSLAHPALAPELKVAQILAGRQGGRAWLQPEPGGLRSCASLRLREGPARP